jgi:SAM-dependent methyltransferase
MLPVRSLRCKIMPLINQRIAYLLKRCRTNGLRSTLMLVGKNLPRPVLEWQIRRRRLQHERFDTKYDIDTQMPVALADLETTAPGAKFATRYQGSPVAVLHRIIRRLKVDRQRFTFIDLGSGKGRVLLIAAQYPFKSVIGIEFSKKLHDIALTNIQKVVGAGATCTSVTSINCDAGEFDFSEIGHKILFCYNSFAADLTIRVLDNLNPPTHKPGETIFAYLGGMPSAVSQKLQFFPIIDKGEILTEFDTYEQYSVYRIH